MYAARKGMVEVVGQQLYAGADVIQAAFAAAENGHVQVLQLLLESGLSADTRSEAGQSLQETAREADRGGIVDLLQSSDPPGSPRAIFSGSSEDVVCPATKDAINSKTSSEKASSKETGHLIG